MDHNKLIASAVGLTVLVVLAGFALWRAVKNRSLPFAYRCPTSGCAGLVRREHEICGECVEDELRIW